MGILMYTYIMGDRGILDRGGQEELYASFKYDLPIYIFHMPMKNICLGVTAGLEIGIVVLQQDKWITSQWKIDIFCFLSKHSCFLLIQFKNMGDFIQNKAPS